MSGPVSSDLRFPDLRFVPAESLVPHEQHDEHRLRALVEKIREQSVLKNPPVVAPLGPECGDEARYVVLDGANRATAARVAGFPHMVVQVVRYVDPIVQLSTWYHAIGSLQAEADARALETIPGLTCVPTRRLHARAEIARREALAYVAQQDGEALTLHGGRDIRERNDLLNAVVDTYRGRGHYYRVTTDIIEDVRARHPEVTAIVVFPRFEPAEILELATSGSRLPAGVTRHVIRWRALRLNIPVERLMNRDQSIEDKNRWLEEVLREKLGQRAVRFYEEPTVLFDE
jgi:hypothetical protein